jgi:hypothetical protein
LLTSLKPPGEHTDSDTWRYLHFYLLYCRTILQMSQSTRRRTWWTMRGHSSRRRWRQIRQCSCPPGPHAALATPCIAWMRYCTRRWRAVFSRVRPSRAAAAATRRAVACSTSARVCGPLAPSLSPRWPGLSKTLTLRRYAGGVFPQPPTLRTWSRATFRESPTRAPYVHFVSSIPYARVLAGVWRSDSRPAIVAADMRVGWRALS